MIAYSFIRFLLGIVALGVALLMAVPCLIAVQLDSPDRNAFLISEAVSIVSALLLMTFNRNVQRKMHVREIFVLTTAAWLVVCMLGALPFVLSHTVGGFTDAIFESVSGVTTTGATVLKNLSSLPPDILLWRSTMQWIGGLGIVALGAAILPFLRIGGMRLFRAESSDFSEKALPHTRHFLLRLLLVYFMISVSCALCYVVCGMSVFDAINHAMTTVSTGGFSTHEESLGYFNSPAIEAVAILFMLIASTPFVLFLPLLSGRFREIRTDGQVGSMLGIYACVSAILVIWLFFVDNDGLGHGLREALFTVVSIGTTTGFVSADYSQWGHFGVIVVFFLTFVGGCTGSTSGGIKILRFKLAYIMFRETLLRLLHPNAVFSRTVGGKPVTDAIMASVMAFALAFACTVGLTAILLTAVGNDFITSFSAAATATANVGPGLGNVIGPTSDFSALNDPSKWILCAAMLLGRLEIFTILVLFTPHFWRN